MKKHNVEEKQASSPVVSLENTFNETFSSLYGRQLWGQVYSSDMAWQVVTQSDYRQTNGVLASRRELIVTKQTNEFSNSRAMLKEETTETGLHLRFF